MSLSTVNILYLAGTIFGGKWLAWIWICVYLNVHILVHIWMAFSDVFELAEAAFRQKLRKRIQRQM